MEQTEPSWGTVREAAERTGLNQMTIRRYITAGRLPARRLGVKLIRVDLNAVDALVAPLVPTNEGAK